MQGDNQADSRQQQLTQSLLHVAVTLLIAVGLAAGDTEDALKFLQQQQVKDSTLVSSVYLDDPDFHTYRSRFAARQNHCICLNLLLTVVHHSVIALPQAFKHILLAVFSVNVRWVGIACFESLVD